GLHSPARLVTARRDRTSCSVLPLRLLFVAIAPLVAACSRDGAPAHTRAILHLERTHTLEVPAGPTSAAGFPPARTRPASGGVLGADDGKALLVFDVDALVPVQTIAMPWLRSLRLSADGRTLAVATRTDVQVFKVTRRD